MTPETLAAATGCKLLDAAQWADALTAAMHRWGIDTPLRQAHFLGQISHESRSLSVLEENLNYSAERLTQVWPRRFPTLSAAQQFARNPRALAERAYGGRGGNTEPGDGWAYRGRGLIQLTFRDNYGAYQQASGVPVLEQPDLLLQPEFAADSAGWFWSEHDCNVFADVDDVPGLTRRINGGQNGLAERARLTERALAVLTAPGAC